MKLKAERLESAKLRKRIYGEGATKKSSSSSKKKYVIDEEAYYNQKDGEDDADDDNGKPKNNTGTGGQGYDKMMKEPNLARKLGLDEEAIEKSKVELDKNRKKTKEELEREKEIDEVR